MVSLASCPPLLSELSLTSSPFPLLLLPSVWYLHHRQYTLQHAEEEDAFDGEKREDPLKLKEFPIGKWSRKESREDWVRLRSPSFWSVSTQELTMYYLDPSCTRL
jgi:hypothetical protein